MNKILLTLMATVTSYVSLHAAIEGTYDVKGFDPYDKKGYTGSCTITKGTNNVFQAKWVLNNEEFTGTGLKGNGEMSFVYKSSTGTEEGLQMYQIDNDTLQGSFVRLNQSLVGTETMKKQ